MAAARSGGDTRRVAGPRHHRAVGTSRAEHRAVRGIVTQLRCGTRQEGDRWESVLRRRAPTTPRRDRRDRVRFSRATGPCAGTRTSKACRMYVRMVIVHRVARLGDEAVRVLSLAAVMGRDFDLATLAALGLGQVGGRRPRRPRHGDRRRGAGGQHGGGRLQLCARTGRACPERRSGAGTTGTGPPADRDGDRRDQRTYPSCSDPRTCLSLRRSVRVVARRQGPPESHQLRAHVWAMLLSRTLLPTRRCAGSDKRWPFSSVLWTPSHRCDAR